MTERVPLYVPPMRQNLFRDVALGYLPPHPGVKVDGRSTACDPPPYGHGRAVPRIRWEPGTLHRDVDVQRVSLDRSLTIGHRVTTMGSKIKGGLNY